MSPPGKSAAKKPSPSSFTNVDEYIAMFPAPVRKKLEEVRAAIRTAAPGAVEKISYRMPAYELDGALVWFAAFKSHIGFYPRGSGIEEFADELQDYVHSKGAVQFPIDGPMPKKLITSIVKFRVRQNASAADTRRKPSR